MSQAAVRSAAAGRIRHAACVNLYDRLAEPVDVHATCSSGARGRAMQPSGASRAGEPGTTMTATYETTDERMINLRHTIAGPSRRAACRRIWRRPLDRDVALRGRLTRN